MTIQADIWTRKDCGYCTKATQLFQKLNIPYKEFIIGAPADQPLESHQVAVSREDLLELVPNARTVPQIWLNGEHVGGYDQLIKHPTVTG